MPETSGPTHSTTPEASWPVISGQTGANRGARATASLWQNPVATTCTTIWSAPGSSRVTSTISCGWSPARSTAAEALIIRRILFVIGW